MPGRRGDDDQNIVATLGAAFGRNRGLGQENEIDTLVMPSAIGLTNRGRETGSIAETLRAGAHGALPMVFGGNNTSGERSVAASLTAHPTGRYDFETENLVCGALSATHGGPDDNSAQAGHIIAFTERGREGGRNLEWQDDLAYTQLNPGKGGRATERAIAGGFGVRRLTPRECERLQGFPEIEERMIIDICFDQQSSPVCVEILNLRSQERVGIAERTNLPAPVSFAGLPLPLSDQWTNRPVHETVLIVCEENSLEIHNRGKSLLSASFAGRVSPSPHPMQAIDFARLLAGARLILDRITHDGKVASQVSERFLIRQEDGNLLLGMSGPAIMQRVSDAMNDSTTASPPLKSITFDPSNTENTAQILTALFCFALSVINGYTPMQMQPNSSFRIDIVLYSDWTAWGIDERGQRVEMSDSARYRMTGNAVCRAVSDWLDRRIIQVMDEEPIR